MKDKAGSQERETAKEKPTMKDQMKDQEKVVTEMADKAMRTCEDALRTGLKLQDEAGRWWSTMFNQTTAAQDWQKRFTNLTAMANEVMPVAQERMEEVLELMEKNTQTGADLMKKAVDAAQTPVIAESQAKWMDFWTSSLGAVRSNAEALTQINTRTIDSWIDFVRRNTEITEIRVPKTP
jgi:hypothetical protein